MIARAFRLWRCLYNNFDCISQLMWWENQGKAGTRLNVEQQLSDWGSLLQPGENSMNQATNFDRAESPEQIPW